MEEKGQKKRRQRQTGECYCYNILADQVLYLYPSRVLEERERRTVAKTGPKRPSSSYQKT